MEHWNIVSVVSDLKETFQCNWPAAFWLSISHDVPAPAGHRTVTGSRCKVHREGFGENRLVNSGY